MAIVLKEVTADLAVRADRMARKLTGLSRSEVTGLFDYGCVSLNGRPCAEISAQVARGDVLAVRYDAHRRYRPRARHWEDDAFQIVFEDKHLIVVDKAAGVLTVPARPGETNTLVHALARYFDHRGGRCRVAGRACRPAAHLVHRLDRGASGLLVFGKTREIAETLQGQFEERKPEREYRAIVKGRLSAREGTFETRLATSKTLQQYSTSRPGEGQLAITHFQLENEARGASGVRVWLETGRRNQIRVHFAEAGHPVLGDERYRPDLSSHPQWRAKRLALHAAALGFRHPVTGKALRFESAIPAPMKAFGLF